MKLTAEQDRTIQNGQAVQDKGPDGADQTIVTVYVVVVEFGTPRAKVVQR